MATSMTTSELERLERLAHAGRVGQRVRGVAALDDHGPVAVGVVGEDLVGDHVARHQPGRRCGRPTTGLRGPSSAGAASTRRTRPRGDHGRRRVLGAGLGEVPGERPDQLLEVADERGVQAHLHAQVLEDGHAGGPSDQAGGGPDVVLGHAGDGAVAGDVDVGQGVDDLVDAGGVLGEPARGRRRPSSTRRRPAPAMQPGVGAGPHLQVDVGQLGGLGAAGVDHDHRPGGVVGDLLQRGAGPGEAVALPRVLADEDHDLAVLDLAPHVGAEHLGVDPELAGLLLGEGVRPVLAGAERGAGRRWRRRRRGGSPARRRRSRGSCRRRGASRTAPSRAATSAMAVSQSTSSKAPSGRRRSGRVSRWPRPGTPGAATVRPPGFW